MSDVDLERRATAQAVESCLEVVYFGRLVRRKGVAHCIEAIQIAREGGVDCRLTVIGQGPEQADLKALAADLGAPVRFLDALPYGDDLFAAIDRAHVLIAAPLSEDTPRSALDAMARGLAVAAYDIAYYRYLADASGAVVTSPFNDPSGLASTITKFSRDRDVLADCMRSARVRRRKHPGGLDGSPFRMVGHVLRSASPAWRRIIDALTRRRRCAKRLAIALALVRP